MIFIFTLLSQITVAQIDTLVSLGGIDFYIHEEVTNADGEIEQELISLWQNYISDGNF